MHPTIARSTDHCHRSTSYDRGCRLPEVLRVSECNAEMLKERVRKSHTKSSTKLRKRSFVFAARQRIGQHCKKDARTRSEVAIISTRLYASRGSSPSIIHRVGAEMAQACREKGHSQSYNKRHADIPPLQPWS